MIYPPVFPILPGCMDDSFGFTRYFFKIGRATDDLSRKMGGFQEIFDRFGGEFYRWLFIKREA
jgi:hypothetical protein